MFTTAAVATNVCALPVGTILDKYGPRVSAMLGSVFFAAGCVFFAFAWQLPFDGYVLGYFLLALGGPFVFISSFQLSNTFPNHSGLILSMLTGAFDSSSAIFLFYRILYDWSGGSFWPKKFFLAYLIVPLFILLVQLFLMPSHSYKTVGELVAEVEEDPYGDAEAYSEDPDIQNNPSLLTVILDERRARRESIAHEITELLGPKGGERRAKREETKKEKSGVWGALHGYTAMEQIRSPWFVLVMLFTVVQMTRINYFVATIRPQYEFLLGDHAKAVHVNSVFDVLLPLGGVVAVPFIGVILDNCSTPFVLSVLVLAATAIGVLGVLPYMWAAYANIALFVVYRPLYYTAVSDYAAKVFGFQTFGKVYGLIICLAGLFNFSQSALDAITHKIFADDPRPVNLTLLGLAVVAGGSLVGFVETRKRALQRELLELEADGASETLMPGAEVNGRARGRGRGYGTGE
ncbi:hypothetical protein FGG08_002117 [Glutinoglossum americanum]|uniref:MFS general substrate transporter n=1 Tax=Glutinoglossum americanum TaxID=1670608 RepID=A0A9P8I6V7_9PEZI|nr:hypothetical protein FGG08_002117 [Glutinoglossum americanum]